MEKENKKKQENSKHTENKENRQIENVSENLDLQNEEILKQEEEKIENEQETLEKELAEIKAQQDELNDKYLRLNADFDNFRKRTLKEKMDLVKNGGADVLQGFLPSLDDIERSMKYINETDEIEALREGVNIIFNSLREFLRQRGIEEIEAINQPFNTNFHEAVSQIPAPNDELKGKVIDVIQKGYKLNDKILRIAKVVVAQ